MAGYQDCVCPFDVWGVHSNAPNISEPLQATGAWPYPYSATDTQTVETGVWPDVGDAGPVWVFSAAKVPSCSPYQSCEQFPPHSSADPRVPEHERWEVSLGVAYEEVQTTDLDGVTHISRENNYHLAFGSRSYYLDGRQKGVSYWISGEGVHGGSSDGQAGRGDVVQIDIDNQTSQKFFIDQAPMFDLGSPTHMESEYLVGHSMPPPTFTPVHPTHYNELSACGRSFGKEYYIESSYFPGAETWSVARVQYDTPQCEFYCTDADYAGTSELGYAVMLPSCKVFILTEPPEQPYGDFDEAGRQPDECWVIAKAGTKVVTGRLLNNTLVSGDADTGAWAGVLLEEEVENIIYQSGDEPEHTVGDVHVRCYQHKDGKDLAILVIGGEDPIVDSYIADFGEDAVEPDLNHGLPEGNGFENPLEENGNQATAQNNAYFIDDDFENAIDTDRYAAEFAVSPASAWHAQLVRTATLVNAINTIEFDYRLDNRAQSAEFPYSYTGNFPATDGNGNYDTLMLFANGRLVWQQDNTDMPVTADTFMYFHHAVVDDIPAGRVVFRWMLVRATASNDMKAWIDNVAFPEELVSEDQDGGRCVYYDGEVIRPIPSRGEWPSRNSDGSAPLQTGSGRPDYITSDYEGRILLANPHTVWRINPDGELDHTFGHGGILRFTASPTKNPIDEIKDPIRKQELQSQLGDLFDSVGDPLWGACQIMALKHGIQLRGMNGSFSDATSNGIPRDNFPDEKFINDFVPYGLGSGGNPLWSRRIHGWTLKNDGRIRVPHIEVLWRFDFAAPAWPDAPAGEPPVYATPPNSTYLEDDGVDWDAAAGADSSNPWTKTMRIRKSRIASLPDYATELMMKPRWFPNNTIYSREYVTTISRKDQYAWIRSPHRDPEETDDPIFVSNYPWPSAQWFPIIAYHNPSTGRRGLTQAPTKVFFNEEDPSQFYYLWRLEYQRTYVPWTDFDAVDCGCDCGCVENNASSMDRKPGADGEVTKVYEFTDDLEDFSSDAEGHLGVIQDAGHAVLYDTATLDQEYNYLNLTKALVFDDLPETASRLKTIQVVSIRAKVEHFEHVVAHRIEVHITTDTGLPITDADSSTLLSASLPTSDSGGWIEYSGFDKQQILEAYQGLDVVLKVKVKWFVYVDMPDEGSDDDPPATEIEVWLDDLTIKAEYENFP